MSKTILYARVSTAEQNLDHQKAQAEAAGFAIDQVVSDHGVSGVHTKLAERPEGKRLFDLLRAGDTLVVRWVDRLGRNYEDVTEAIRHFMQQGVIIKTVINGFTFDGSTADPVKKAVRDALIAFMAAISQAQAEATKEAQRAGIQAAKQKEGVYRGRRPSYSQDQLETVQEMLAEGAGASRISKVTGLSRQTILRIKDDPSLASEALARWS